MSGADRIVLRCDGLRKTFRGGVEAVRGVSFSIDEGEIFGLLGPNGAGKTTIMRILATLLRPSAGTANVAGHDIADDPGGVRRSIGFAMQEVGLAEYSTGRENLVMMGRLYGLSRSAARKRARELLELFGLDQAADRVVRTYSGGMKRRLDLATGLVHRPRLLFLDEPTTGVDPTTRAALWDELRRLQDLGVSIFLKTHYLDEADRVCDRPAIIHDGTFVAEGRPEAPKGEIGADVVTVSLEPAELEAAQATLVEVGRLRPHEDGAVSLETPEGAAAVVSILERLQRAGIRPRSVTVARPTLDDVFFRHTGATIEGGEEPNE